jgi:hypothetical protein
MSVKIKIQQLKGGLENFAFLPRPNLGSGAAIIYQILVISHWKGKWSCVSYKTQTKCDQYFLSVCCFKHRKYECTTYAFNKTTDIFTQHPYHVGI